MFGEKCEHQQLLVLFVNGGLTQMQIKLFPLVYRFIVVNISFKVIVKKW